MSGVTDTNLDPFVRIGFATDAGAWIVNYTGQAYMGDVYEALYETIVYSIGTPSVTVSFTAATIAYAQSLVLNSSAIDVVSAYHLGGATNSTTMMASYAASGSVTLLGSEAVTLVGMGFGTGGSGAQYMNLTSGLTAASGCGAPTSPLPLTYSGITGWAAYNVAAGFYSNVGNPTTTMRVGIQYWTTDGTSAVRVMGFAVVTTIPGSTGSSGLTLTAAPTITTYTQAVVFGFAYSGSSYVTNGSIHYGDGHYLAFTGLPDYNTYNYRTSGTFTAYANVTLGDGSTIGSNSIGITVTAGGGGEGGGGGNLTFAASTTTPLTGQSVSFTWNYAGTGTITNVTWHSGDGQIYITNGTQQAYTWFYGVAGVYVNCYIMATFSDGSTLNSNYLTMTVSAAYTNILSLVVQPVNLTVGQSVQAALIASGQGTILFTTYYWGDFHADNLTNGFVNLQSHTYTTVGVFNVTAEIGIQGSSYPGLPTLYSYVYSNTVLVNVTASVANSNLTLSASPTSISDPATAILFTFNYSGSRSVLNTTLYYGDSQYNTYTGLPSYISYHYRTNGTYLPYAQASLSDGSTISSNTVTITVGLTSSPNLTLSCNNAAPHPGDSVTFSWTYVGQGNVVQIIWYSGDGQVFVTGPQQTNSWVYMTVGVYTNARIMATFDDNSTLQSNRLTITVAKNPDGGSGSGAFVDFGQTIQGGLGSGGMWILWVVLILVVTVVLAGGGLNPALAFMGASTLAGVIVFALFPSTMIGALILSVVLDLTAAVFMMRGGGGGAPNARF